MLPRTIALLAALTLAHHASAQQVDNKSLRDLVRMPTIDFTFGLGFNGEGRIIIMGEERDLAGEIAALEKALCGDAGDADRYCRLSDLYNDKKKSQAAAHRAVELANELVNKNPGNGRLAMLMGDCLWAADQKVQAETWYRRSVEQAPQDADCWLGLGSFLTNSAMETLLGEKGTKGFKSFKDVVTAYSRQFPMEATAKYRMITREAETCHDRAVALAPWQAKSYMSRASFRTLSTMVDALQTRQECKQAPETVVKYMYSAAVLADVQKAAELSPGVPRLQTVAALFQALIVVFNPEPGAARDKPFSEATRRKIAECTGRLTKLLSDPDRKIAAEAGYGLAGVEFILDQDWARMEQLLRTVVKQNPDLNQAWDLLVVSAMDNYKDLITICEDRLRIKDSPRSRYLAAKSHMELDQFAQAEQHLRIALFLDPRDIRSHLGLTAVALKRGDKAGLTDADKLLARADLLLKDNPNAALKAEAVLLRGFHAALAGDTASARRNWQSVVESGNDKRTALKLLQMLGN